MATELYKHAAMGRLSYIVWAFLIAVAGLLAFHFFGATWSNRCDPGNQQFALLKSDGVVTFAPDHQLFTWENDRPDNLWLCANANLSVSHIGPNIKDVYEQTRGDMTRNGWSEIAPGTSSDFSVYEKTTAGVTLSAVVRKEVFWVEVDLSAPGLRPGESGLGQTTSPPHLLGRSARAAGRVGTS